MLEWIPRRSRSPFLGQRFPLRRCLQCLSRWRSMYLRLLERIAMLHLLIRTILLLVRPLHFTCPLLLFNEAL